MNISRRKWNRWRRSELRGRRRIGKTRIIRSKREKEGKISKRLDKGESARLFVCQINTL